MGMNWKAGWSLLKETATEWQEDKASLLAASLAYYTVFSLAPLLIIAIAIAGSVFGEEAARGEIVGRIQGLVGAEAAKTIQSMLENINRPGSGGVAATLFGIATLLFGASGVFAQLQEALNLIWEVKPRPGQGVMSFVRSRFLSFAMVVVIGFLLLLFLILTATLTGVSHWIDQLMPGVSPIWHLVNFVLSFGIETLLFALLYKVLPDVEMPWNDLWIGSAVTALLFNLGKMALGLYLGSNSVSSAYGAAGSLVVILLWVYYSAQILLFGAEFIQVYAKRTGSQIRPSKHAVSTSESASGAGIATVGTNRTRQAVLEPPPASTPPPARPSNVIWIASSLVALALGNLRSNRYRSRRRSRRRF